ncbi:hypothetical protein [Cellulomonas hominis]
MDTILPVLAAVVPSLGVGILFWLAIRALVNADRTERAALARMDARDRRAAAEDNRAVDETQS